MKPISDIDIFLKLSELEKPACLDQLFDVFEIPQSDRDFFHLRINDLVKDHYLVVKGQFDKNKNLCACYGLGRGAQNALSEYRIKRQNDELQLHKSRKDHILAVIGAISGLFGGATGLIALLLQLFQNTPPPAP